MNASTTIIAVSYYTGSVLFDMIAAALAQPDVAAVVLVNNGNPLPVYQRLADMAEAEPRFTLVSGQGNIGFAAASNMGARMAMTDNLLFLNPDCVLPPDFVPLLAAESTRLAHPHLIGARVIEADGREQSGSRRAILTPWTAFVEVFALYRLFPNHPHFKRFKWHEQDVPDKTIPVPAVSGALVFSPKGDFWKTGGFDEGYFLHVEDIDLCLKMHAIGGGVYFMPAPSVLHLGGTSKAPTVLVEWHKTRSFVRYFYKNFSNTYPRFALWFISLAVWLRFAVQGCSRLFARKNRA